MPEDDPSAETLSGAKRGPLSHNSFRLFWLIRIGSSIAFQMFGVVIGWQLYAMTGSALDLGLVGLAQFLPMVILTFVVGQVADRYDRRTILRICQVVTGSIAITFIAATLGGWISRQMIFTLVSLLGASRAFEGPSIMALLPQTVPREDLPKATAWSSSANQTAQIAGPSLAGVLYGVGPIFVYSVILCAAIGGSICLMALKLSRRDTKPTPVTLRSVFSGVGFVWKHPAILGAMSLDLFAVLLGGATALLPIFAQDILSTGAWGLGLLRAAPAVGALTMSLILARWPIRGRAGTLMLCGVATFGLATVVFGLSRSLPLSLCALMVLGASDMLSVVVRLSLVQLRTPPDMLGRVSALSSLFIGTSNQLGEFESGTTAALFGTVPAVLIGGFGTILVAALWAVLFPSLRNLRNFDERAVAKAGSDTAQQAI